MTSPDGITWTIRSSAADNNWLSVIYGSGLFVAVANTTVGNRVMTSPDGITWTIRSSAADNNWSSVTYGNGLFIAVANSGVGNRVMTLSLSKNKTHRIFIPVVSDSGLVKNIAGWTLDTAGQQLSGFTVVPDGIVAPQTAKMFLVWRAKVVVGIAVVTSHYYSAAHDEPYNTNTDVDANRTLASVDTINDIGIEDLDLDFTDVTEGEQLQIYTLAAAGITEDLYVQGWIFEYTTEE